MQNNGSFDRIELLSRDPEGYDAGMILAGKVEQGVIVPDRDEMSPDGTIVAVIPARVPSKGNADRMPDTFGGAGHNRALYAR